MSLSGLLRVIADDPQLKRALDEAEAPVSIGADLIAPPALRPFLAAALAGAGRGDAGGGSGDEGAGRGRGPADDGAGHGRSPADEGTGRGRDLADEGIGGRGRFVLAVTATAREAEDLTSALGSLLPAGAAAYFPPWETLPHERLSPRSDTSGQRLAVLR